MKGRYVKKFQPIFQKTVNSLLRFLWYGTYDIVYPVTTGELSDELHHNHDHNHNIDDEEHGLMNSYNNDIDNTFISDEEDEFEPKVKPNESGHDHSHGHDHHGNCCEIKPPTEPTDRLGTLGMHIRANDR